MSVSASVGGSDVVSRDDRALEPSELSSVAPSSPLFDPTVVATRRSQDTDTVECVPHSCSDLRCVELGPSPYSSDSISDRVSVSRDTAGTPVSVRLSVTENFDDPDTARVLQDSLEPPKAAHKVCDVFSSLRGSLSSPLTVYLPFPSTVRATRITRGKAKRYYRATELLPRPRPQQPSKAAGPGPLLQRNRNRCPSIADPVSRTLASNPSRRCAGTSSATGTYDLGTFP